MRGDAALTVRLLLRGPGLAGTTIAVAGVLGVVSTLLAWQLEIERVELLGGGGERILSTVRGLSGEPLAWLVLAAAILLIWFGLTLALDRPPTRARSVAALAAVVLMAAGATAVIVGQGHTPAEATDRTRDGEVALPVGVEVTTVHRTGTGPWLAVASGALALGGALAARER
ncbi:MAG: hypothetical protein WD638_02670 [Nitriliruptoraceae bacterium]